MTNDQNTVLDDVKGWLRDRGLTKSNLKSYKYWILSGQSFVNATTRSLLSMLDRAKQGPPTSK